MPDQIYLDPDATSAEFIKVGNKCYRRVGTSATPPNTSSFEAVEDCDACNSTCPCGNFTMNVTVYSDDTYSTVTDSGNATLLLCSVGGATLDEGLNTATLGNGTTVAIAQIHTDGNQTVNITVGAGDIANIPKSDSHPTSIWGTYANQIHVTDPYNYIYCSITDIVATQAPDCATCGATFSGDCPSTIACTLAGLPTVSGYNGDGDYTLTYGSSGWFKQYTYSDDNISITLSCNTQSEAGIGVTYVWTVGVTYNTVGASFGSGGTDLITACFPDDAVQLYDESEAPSGTATFS